MGYVKILTDQYPQAILRHIWETSKNAEFFFLKNYPPAQQKPFFLNQRPPPLDFKKYFFSNGPKSYFYQSHCIALGLTIPKWYNTWVLKIFFVNIFFKNIFLNFFFQKFSKIFLKLFSIPKCYTILESWEQMP